MGGIEHQFLHGVPGRLQTQQCLRHDYAQKAACAFDDAISAQLLRLLGAFGLDQVDRHRDAEGIGDAVPTAEQLFFVLFTERPRRIGADAVPLFNRFSNGKVHFDSSPFNFILLLSKAIIYLSKHTHAIFCCLLTI